MINKVGIIGLGSIGRRHVRILHSLRNDIQFYSYRTRAGAMRESVENVAELDRDAFFSLPLDVVIISNPTSLHLETLQNVLVANNARTILVEKPFCLPGEFNAASRLISEHPGTRVLPGNCLRFHPAVAVLKELQITDRLGRALECHAHFGTYMPGWHPYEDYRFSYASRKDLGGGVLLTSIHEIDLAHHLFGKGEVIGSYLRRLVLREIDVEDTAHIILTMEKCGIVNISLNYFERPADRFLKVIFERGVFAWKFGESEVSVAYAKPDRIEQTGLAVSPDVDSMYANMWTHVLNGTTQDLEMEAVRESLNAIAAVRQMNGSNI